MSLKFLFVHQNYPAQFLHILRHLAATGRHEILFITEPNQNEIAGVRKVPYLKPQLDTAETHPAARELDNGIRRAEAVHRTALGLKHLGYTPDMIVGHHGWGEMLNLRDLWPQSPMLGYMEFFYRPNAADVGFDPEFPNDPSDYPRIRAKNAINHIALNLGSTGQTPTKWQLSTYPDWARPNIELIWEGVDLDLCRPDPAGRKSVLRIGDLTIKPTDKLVTYVSRDLEPYRGFHVMMRALPDILRGRKDVKVIMIGGDGVSYGTVPFGGGTWRETMLAEVGKDIDMSRVVFPGRVSYSVYLSALQRSDAHVYLTYPFVASWSMREALAIGCPVIGGDTEPVSEFITHGVNGLLTPCLEPRTLAKAVLGLLEDKILTGNLRENARSYAVKTLAMSDYLASYCGVIERLSGENPAPDQPVKTKPTRPVVRAKPKAAAQPRRKLVA